MLSFPLCLCTCFSGGGRVVFWCKSCVFQWLKFYFSNLTEIPPHTFEEPEENPSAASLLYSVFVVVLPQNEDSSTHEKLDFKLHFTCTSYLITTPCYRLVYYVCVHKKIYTKP